MELSVIIENFFSAIGSPIVKSVGLLNNFGVFLLFQARVFPLIFTTFSRTKLLMKQIELIGIGTVGVVALTALFTGMVEAIQLYNGFHDFGVENFMGYTIFVSITKELGPVFATLMLISRAVSAMAAELGTMRVTEQIDAIETLGVDSKKYLIVPRIVATTLSLPMLVLVFDFVAITSAFYISTVVLDINPIPYQDTIMRLGHFSDIGTGLIKAAVFGFIVSSIGTYIGYFTRGGARGVGLSTIYAVVYSAVSIFVANYFLSSFFLFLGW
jgi:phospholipid/cholesterol/gamma-HCH transport system permease protein